MTDMVSGNGSTIVPVNAESDNDDEEGETHDIRGSDDDEQEDPKDYCKGGYHPITIGSIFNQRYHVIRKLGWGKLTIRFKNTFIVFFRSFFYCMVMLGS
jgi:hypothetical protein